MNRKRSIKKFLSFSITLQFLSLPLSLPLFSYLLVTPTFHSLEGVRVGTATLSVSSDEWVTHGFSSLFFHLVICRDIQSDASYSFIASVSGEGSAKYRDELVCLLFCVFVCSFA